MWQTVILWDEKKKKKKKKKQLNKERKGHELGALGEGWARGLHERGNHSIETIQQ